jgi:formylmethanofuran dehydrogenase subunit E
MIQAHFFPKRSKSEVTMSVDATTGAKLCCKCGKDVTHIGRMKGSDGRYWCIDCGEKDEERRGEHSGGICFGCGESFIKPDLTKLGGHIYCRLCAKKQFGVKKSFLGKVWAAMIGKGSR